VRKWKNLRRKEKRHWGKGGGERGFEFAGFHMRIASGKGSCPESKERASATLKGVAPKKQQTERGEPGPKKQKMAGEKKMLRGKGRLGTGGRGRGSLPIGGKDSPRNFQKKKRPRKAKKPCGEGKGL